MLSKQEVNNLIIQNEKLIYYFINRNKNLISYYFSSEEDARQTFCLYLVEKLNTYDPSKNCKISTYILRLLRYCLLHTIKYSQWDVRKANNNSIESLDTSFISDLNICTSSSSSTNSIKDLIVDNVDYFERIYASIEFQKIKKYIKKETLLHYYFRYSILEIKKILNLKCSVSAISMRIAANLKKLKQMLEKNKFPQDSITNAQRAKILGISERTLYRKKLNKKRLKYITN